MILATREDYVRRVSDHIGQDNTDEALSFLEDMSDTYDFLSSGSGERIRELEDENRSLREKYRQRFTEPGQHFEDPTPETKVEETKELTYENLFTTE